ncbi:hypothetical protein PHMEG_0007720 [Phytophthora megakarya]|uniref:Uncharacterized protein n=1 Tax=Phytophthora megakarya TaxID=4795 RepID=A0A225WMM8_9STRA|nr:hypothetical protein PHMEG_0007720 [Phytophthora megakarya]
MSGYTICSIQCGSPIQRNLSLPTDEVARRNILRSMKTQKLEDARKFMSRKLLHLNPLHAMSEERRFENDEGDYWSVRFTTSQFEPARSVKQVFDLVVYFLSNSEISISEKTGHLTVREDDDNGSPGIAQHRLVSTTEKGLHMEWNTIMFYEYCEADSYGLIVSEFVDEDEKYPYRPTTRIRKDVNVVMEVRAYSGKPHEIQDKTVVLTLWSYHHLLRPVFPVPQDAWVELRESMDRWTQNMHKTIMESLDPTI